MQASELDLKQRRHRSLWRTVHLTRAIAKATGAPALGFGVMVIVQILDYFTTTSTQPRPAVSALYMMNATLIGALFCCGATGFYARMWPQRHKDTFIKILVLVLGIACGILDSYEFLIIISR